MRAHNQNKNTERSAKNWVKVFDLWRAERSEVRKLESNICHVHLFLDAIWLIGNRTTCLSNLEIIGLKQIPQTAKLDSAYGLVQFWLSSEFLSCNYFIIGELVVLLCMLIMGIQKQKIGAFHAFLIKFVEYSSKQSVIFVFEQTLEFCQTSIAW